jgi:hypothetical protein
MTSWGNTKQRAAFAGAIVLFVAAIFLANEASPAWAILPFVFGCICFAGVWALGLPVSADPDNAEAMDAIR